MNVKFRNNTQGRNIMYSMGFHFLETFFYRNKTVFSLSVKGNLKIVAVDAF